MLEVLGLHPVAADEPVHLIRVAIDGEFDDVDWGEITQPTPGEPRESWQVPYDEQELETLPDGRAQAVFFFHYLDVTKPLETPFGSVPLPAPTPIPKELASVKYEAP